MIDILRDKNILITGGTGTIGHALAARILPVANCVRVLSRGEFAQYQMRERFCGSSNLELVIGDVRDAGRLSEIMGGIDIVIHAAALKHVEICESNPFEAVLTNVHGTKNVIHSAKSAGVDRLIFISSDKAADPVNVYGMTKALSERLVTSESLDSDMKMCSVRYGNVLGSRGSVAHKFRNQPDKIYITHQNMVRYLMTRKAAVDLILNAATYVNGGEIFVKVSPATLISDLARAISPNADLVMLTDYHSEKLSEVLITEEESSRTTRCTYEQDLLRIAPHSNQMFGGGWNRVPVMQYSSDNAKRLTIPEISRIVTSEMGWDLTTPPSTETYISDKV